MAFIQLIIVHRGPEWTLLKNGTELGSYDDLAAARRVAGMLAEQARLAGDECELLIRDGDWREEACPESPQPLPSG